MAGSGALSAFGHLPYASTVPGSHRAVPCDPGGAPYGRTEYGRSRRAAGRNPRRGKGVLKTAEIDEFKGGADLQLALIT